MLIYHLSQDVTASLASEMYKACLRSADSFKPITNDIASFRYLLEITEENVAELGKDNKYLERIASIVSGCKGCLDELRVSVNKYEALPTSSQWTWERMQLGQGEIADLQRQLGINIGLLSTLNNSITK